MAADGSFTPRSRLLAVVITLKLRVACRTSFSVACAPALSERLRSYGPEIHPEEVQPFRHASSVTQLIAGIKNRLRRAAR